MSWLEKQIPLHAHKEKLVQIVQPYREMKAKPVHLFKKQLSNVQRELGTVIFLSPIPRSVSLPVPKSKEPSY